MEIEFAGNLAAEAGARPQFAFLQLRPLAMSSEEEEVEIGVVEDRELVCRSATVLGNGLVSGLHDLVVVDIQRFERMKSQEVALQVARFGRAHAPRGTSLRPDRRRALGIERPAPGHPRRLEPDRGSPGDRRSGGSRTCAVAPSQGTHFFQNLASSHVGYFTVNPDLGDGLLDWDWLSAQEAIEETPFVRAIRLPEPVVVKMSGKTGEGVILKPQDSPTGKNDRSGLTSVGNQPTSLSVGGGSSLARTRPPRAHRRPNAP